VRSFILALCLASVAHAAHFSEQALSRDQMTAAVLGVGIRAVPQWAALNYAPMRRAELTTFQAMFRARLSKAGVPVSYAASGWQARFNCWAFCEAFVVEASLALMLEQHHSWSKAERPAIIPFAFTRADGACHAILLIITDAGPVWWDPQTGEHRNLTAAELASVWYPEA
jgi:hypothetical protein